MRYAISNWIGPLHLWLVTFYWALSIYLLFMFLHKILIWIHIKTVKNLFAHQLFFSGCIPIHHPAKRFQSRSWQAMKQLKHQGFKCSISFSKTCLIKMNHQLNYIATCGEKWYTGSHSGVTVVWRFHLPNQWFKSQPKQQTLNCTSPISKDSIQTWLWSCLCWVQILQCKISF